MMICELSYVLRTSGQSVVEEVAGFREACERAKALASQTGTRVTIRKLPTPQWTIITVDLTTGQTINTEIAMTKSEAAKLWMRWKPKKEQAVCVMWPRWAPPLSAKIKVSAKIKA